MIALLLFILTQPFCSFTFQHFISPLSSNMADETSFVNTSHGSSPSENPNSPFFLHHCDNANTVVVTPHLTGPNYLSWNRLFTLAVSIKNKLGFLDWTIETPSLSDPLYVPWLRCNNLIPSWLLNSISKKIAFNVLYINSAKIVWYKLKARFAQPDSVRIYQRQQQLASITQESQSVSG